MPQESALLTGIRVLLVEDRVDEVDMYTVVLEREGALVGRALTARRALELVGQHPPHVIVTDLGLPDMTGYELLESIRALGRESGGDVPAIVLTGWPGEFYHQASLKAGVTKHFTNPVPPMDLVQAIAELVGRAEN